MSGKGIGDTYLGDGVYASFDGYAIWLDLRAQDTTTKICLEPAVLSGLDSYRRRCAALSSDPNDVGNVVVENGEESGR